MKKKLIIFLLALHLFVLLLGTNMIDYGRVPASLHGPVGYYLSLVGGHSYSFFSPDIPTQAIVCCEVTDRSGHVQTVIMDSTDNEFMFRAVYLFQFVCSNDDYEAAAKIAAHFSAKQINGARHVKVTIGRCLVPGIHEYKDGKRNDMSELYTQNFSYD